MKFMNRFMNPFKQHTIGYIYIYIYDKYYIKTHVVVFLFSVKNACLNYREFGLEGYLVGGTPYVLFIGPIFHNTIETCLKRVGHGGYE